MPRVEYEDCVYGYQNVVLDGKSVGTLKPSAIAGKGFYLALDGHKWRNVGPSPRYHQEADRAERAHYTHVKTRGAASKLVLKTLG